MLVKCIYLNLICEGISNGISLEKEKPTHVYKDFILKIFLFFTNETQALRRGGKKIESMCIRTLNTTWFKILICDIWFFNIYVMSYIVTFN